MVAVWSPAIEEVLAVTDDDDSTPRERVITDSERNRHFDLYPSRTAVVRELQSTPRSAFEQHLQERQDKMDGRLASLEASRGFWRWVAGLGIPVLLSFTLGLLLYGAGAISTSAERAGETRAEIRALQEEVHNLRLKIDKLAGVDQKPVTIVQAR